MNSKVITIIIVVVVVLLGAWWLLMRNDASAPANQTETTHDATSTSPSNASTNPTEPTPVAAVITYADNGFEPKQTIVKSGDTIRITNNSQNPLSLNSDAHPTHMLQPELNVGDVEPGQSKTFVLTKTGTWGFHNHDNSTHTGSITVQ